MMVDLGGVGHGVTTVEVLGTPRKHVGGCIANPQIGNQGRSVVIRYQEAWLAESGVFSKEQLEIMQKMINQSINTPSSSNIGTGSLAHRGLGFGEDDWQC